MLDIKRVKSGAKLNYKMITKTITAMAVLALVLGGIGQVSQSNGVQGNSSKLICSFTVGSSS